MTLLTVELDKVLQRYKMRECLLNVRLSQEMMDALDEFCLEHSVTKSDAARVAISILLQMEYEPE